MFNLLLFLTCTVLGTYPLLNFILYSFPRTEFLVVPNSIAIFVDVSSVLDSSISLSTLLDVQIISYLSIPCRLVKRDVLFQSKP